MAGKRGNGEHSIYQSGGRWHVQGWIGDKRVRVSATKRAEAWAKWQSRVGEAQRHPESPEGGPAICPTVAEALEHWYRLCENKWAYSTARGYRHAIDHHITPTLGQFRADELSIAVVEQWQHHLLRGRLAPSTVRQARIVLGQAVGMLVRYGQLPSNPVHAAAALPKAAAEPDFLTQAEAAKVLAAADDPTDRARWLLGLTLGLRSGEVLGLRWDDLALDSAPPQLTITGSLQFQTGRGLVRVPPKTTHSRRTVVLAGAHVEALRALRAQQARRRLESAAEYNPEGYVFVTPRGTPVDPANDAKRWHALLDAAGVRRVRRHDARHTAATLMMGAGAGLANVQKVLGHSSIRTTVDVYGHLVAADAAPFTTAVTDSLTAPQRDVDHVDIWV